jgi:hypothetical protein
MEYNPETRHKFEFTPEEVKELDLALTARVDMMQALDDDYDCDSILGTLQMEFEDITRDLADVGEI